jgi:hypothetical protein
LGSSAVSSMVSCSTAMVLRPGSGICAMEDEVIAGVRRMSALEVFFCRSEYVLSDVFKTAERSDEERVRLRRRVAVSGCARYEQMEAVASVAERIELGQDM